MTSMTSLRKILTSSYNARFDIKLENKYFISRSVPEILACNIFNESLNIYIYTYMIGFVQFEIS